MQWASPEAVEADAVAAAFRGRGLPALAYGSIVRLSGFAEGVGERAVRVDVSWNERGAPGAAFVVGLFADAARVADGRTGSRDDLVDAVLAWLAGDSLDDVVARWPFVERPRERSVAPCPTPPQSDDLKVASSQYETRPIDFEKLLARIDELLR